MALLRVRVRSATPPSGDAYTRLARPGGSFGLPSQREPLRQRGDGRIPSRRASSLQSHLPGSNRDGRAIRHDPKERPFHVRGESIGAARGPLEQRAGIVELVAGQGDAGPGIVLRPRDGYESARGRSRTATCSQVIIRSDTQPVAKSRPRGIGQQAQRVGGNVSK